MLIEIRTKIKIKLTLLLANDIRANLCKHFGVQNSRDERKNKTGFCGRFISIYSMRSTDRDGPGHVDPYVFVT